MLHRDLIYITCDIYKLKKYGNFTLIIHQSSFQSIKKQRTFKLLAGGIPMHYETKSLLKIIMWLQFQWVIGHEASCVFSLFVFSQTTSFYSRFTLGKKIFLATILLSNINTDKNYKFSMKLIVVTQILELTML